MRAILDNWKTTGAAIILIALVVAFLLGRMTLEQFNTAAFAAIAYGLVAAKDSK